MGASGQRHNPAALFPGKKPGARFTWRLVGPRDGLDRYGKSRPHQGCDPKSVHLVASRYTGCAIAANINVPHVFQFTKNLSPANSLL